MSLFINIFLVYTVLSIGTNNRFFLKEVIDIALKNNPDIIIAEDELKKKQSRLDEVKAAEYPKGDVSLGFSHASDPTLVSTLSGNETYYTRFSVSQPLYSWGRSLNTITIAELEVQKKEEEIKETKLQFTYDLVKAFYDCILANEFRKVADDNVKRLQLHLETTKVLVNNGVLTKYDCLRAEAELAKANVNLLKAGTDIENTKEILNRKMNLELDKEITIEDELKYEKKNFNLHECIIIALNNRVEIRKNQIDEKTASASKDLTYSGLNPNISLTGNFTLQDNRSKLTLLPDNWMGFWGIGVVFSVPIFDWLRTCYVIEQEDLTLNQVKSRKKKIETDIEVEIRQSIRKIKEIDEVILYQSKVIEHAEESLRLARVRFEHGLITSAEVMDIESILTSAKMDYLKLIYEHTIEIMMLKKAMGEKNV